MRSSSIKLLYILVATLMAGALQSCDDDYFNGGEGTKVTINATTAFSNTTSRAVFEEDTYFESGDIVITNYCFLLFGDDGALIDLFDINALPYVAELSKPVVGKNYHAFLLGNVDKETLEESGAINTIADLQSRTFEINRMYNLPKEEEKSKFTWSSYLPFSLSAKNLNFILNPNVAKITAKITNSSSESVIKSVRVKNVVNKVGYAQNALNEYSPDYVKNVSSEPTLIKYDIETFDTPIATGESKTISWYVPQNIQGDGTRKPAGDVDANETYLHGEIPDNATYVEIDGVRPSDNVTASYRVYPGIKKDGETGYADMTNFDVKADVIYNLNITISNDGIDADVSNGYKPNNGSTATAKIKLPENSNCYMIHPIGDRIADVTVYELPISRVNQYWATVAGEPGTQADDHALTADSKWHVEVIWQDINTRAIEFCDEYGVSTEKDANGEVYSPGEGLNPFCFKLVNNSTDPGSQTYGNVLVGLKKDGVEGYCWSWHLWITDYNPDAASAHGSNASNLLFDASTNVDRQGVNFAVESTDSWTNTNNVSVNYTSQQYVGNVQHYHSKYSVYYDVLAGMWETGIYKNKWIMDRNLGAQSPNNSEIEKPLEGWGMYYQYGRKDPFIYNYTYDIEGNPRSSYSYSTAFTARQHWKTNQTESGTSLTGTVQNSIKNPTTYFTANGSWAGESTPQYDWFSPTPAKAGAKTLFDPCPPGWCVPLIDVFTFGFYSYPKTFKEYARTFADDINPNNWEHTSVCAYVNVEGTYRNPKDYAGTTVGKIDYRNISNDYNESLTNYGDNLRNFGVLYSSDIVNGSNKVLKSHFPLQGHINGDNGNLVKVFQKSGIKPIHDDVTGVVWKNYTCAIYGNDGSLTGGAGLQARLWGFKRGTTTSSTIGGTLMNLQTATLDNNVNARQEQRNGRLYMRFHGMLHTDNIWNASNGFNVRCIQEPD